MKSKKCTICLYERPIDDFNYANAINGIRPNGTPNLSSVAMDPSPGIHGLYKKVQADPDENRPEEKTIVGFV